MAEEWMLSDAHAHLGTLKERQEREKDGILSILCAVSPSEADTLWGYLKKSGPENCLVPACGIHPWYTHQIPVEEMEPWLKIYPVIGEIGMDSVWCDVPLKIQEETFRKQLFLASKWKKPVVLHTKGQEKEIAGIIKEYPNRYLVHWYSCESYLEEYISMDCYFSVGPDVWWNLAVRKVAGQVPLNRLLIETDGLDAVKWAEEEGRKRFFGPKVQEGLKGSEPESHVAYSLRRTLKTVAGIRKIPPKEAGEQFFINLREGFLEGAGYKK